jgi:hypothetical protein
LAVVSRNLGTKILHIFNHYHILMANKQNIKATKQAGPGCPPNKKSRKLDPAEEVAETPP